MRTKKTYKLHGSSHSLDCFSERLDMENLKFKETFKACDCYGESGELHIEINISKDMITEVEELLHELAKKTGVRIE